MRIISAPHRLLPASVGIGNDASLIVAALDLQLVRTLTRSIARNAICPLLGPCDRLTLRSRLRAELRDRFLPREVIVPEPRFTPRPVIHPTPRFEPRPVERPAEPEQPVRLNNPIDPPWKVLAHEIPLQPAPRVKVNIHRPDVIHKGTLIDLFI